MTHSKTDCGNYKGVPLLPTTYKILPNILLLIYCHIQMKLLATICVDFDVTDQHMIIGSEFIKYLEMGIQCGHTSNIYRLQESL
jgi:hypothetical protein